MLAKLGAEVMPVEAPFRPEGGAYGHGRTLGHEHGPDRGQGLAHVHHHVSHYHPDDEEDDDPEVMR